MMIGRIAAVASLALVLTGCAIHPNDNTLPGQVAVGDDGYTATVTFDRVENLVANSTVQRANVVIGTVAKIEVVDWQAKVTLRLLRSVKLPANSTFSIGQKTLLGAQYVQVDEPENPRGVLANNAVVPVERTGLYPATEQVLASAALLLNNGGLSQISTITSELNSAFEGRTLDTRQVVGRLNDLLEVLDRNKVRLVSTLESLESLSKQAAEDKKIISDALGALAPGLKALNEERSDLVRTVTALGKTSSTAGKLVEVNKSAILSNLASLRPILGQLGKVADQLPEALKIALSIPFPIMTTDNAVKGDYANLFATVDLSVEGLAANFLKGGLLPSMQAGNPVLDPALFGGDASAAAEPSVTPKDTADRQQENVAPPSVPKDDDPVAPPEKSCGLLAMLGFC